MPGVTDKTDRRDFLAFLGALSLFFAAIEYLFPKPIPFFRLGLSNLPLLVALDVLRFREVLLLVVIKVLGQGLVNGTLISYVFAFSLAGSLGSALVMVGIRWWDKRRKKPWFSLVGVSLWGALASNLVQVALSLVFVFGPTAWIIAPLFLTLGTGAGLAVGLTAQGFVQNSQWWRRTLDGLAR